MGYDESLQSENSDLSSDLGRPLGGKIMSSNTIAGAVFATGVWAAFAFAMVSGAQLNPQTHAWVSTSSDKVASHPILVRAAYPRVASMLSGRS